MPTQIQQDAAACGVCKFIADDYSTLHFQSRTNTKVYHTVSMHEWKGSGECSCPHFQFRIRPLLAAGLLKPHSDAAACRHLKRANKILLVAVKRKMFAA